MVGYTELGHHLRGLGPTSPVNTQMDPPQIATEGFSSDSLSERSPEHHIENLGKSRLANIIVSGIIQNGCKNILFGLLFSALNTNMYFAICINLFNHMMNLLSYKVICFRPNSSRKFKMAAMKTLFVHLIVPINAIYKNVISYCINKMTTYVSSSYSSSSVMFSYILAQMPRHSPQPVEQSNPA